jgi:superfamily II DNA helicase RecQ
MAVKFFVVPALDPQAAEEELNRFLRAHRAVSVSRELVVSGERVLWCVAVEYLEGANVRSESSAGGETGRKGRVDYRDLLPPAEFALFSKLRELRKAIADAEAVPVYAVFTNEQLASMARQRPQTRQALQGIEGIGEAKAERYGQRVIELLGASEQQRGEPGGASA